MRKGVWVGGLVLSLGGWLGLSAQELAWRPVAPRPLTPGSALDLEPIPAAELGRPVALIPSLWPQRPLLQPGRPLLQPVAFEQSAAEPLPDLAPLPAAPVTAATPVTVSAPAPVPSEVSGPPPAIIATSAAVASPSAPSTEAGSAEPSEFAQDRRPFAPRYATPLPARPAAARGLVAPVTWSAPVVPRGPVCALTYWTPDGATAQTVQPVAAYLPQAGPPLPVEAAPAASEAAPNPSTWVTAPMGTNPWTVAPAVDPAGGGVFEPAGACPCGCHVYADAEYLLWWLRGERTPPLLTTSSASDFGILGNPTTRIIFGGNSSLNDEARSGARFTVGCVACDGLGFEISGFFLAPRATDFTAFSSTFPTLGRPFFNVNTNANFAQLVALPGVSTGNAVINAPSEFWGAEANLRCCVCSSDCYQVNAFAGFRYLDLDESLKITENIQGLATAPPPFTSEKITVFDRFATHNQFYGGQIGVQGRYNFGQWSVEGKFKLGLGATEQTIDIAGGQRFVAPDGTTNLFKGGLLALPSNIGHFSQARFSVVPEVGINVGYQWTPHLRTFIGYNFLDWTNVVRPGDQIDTHLNVFQIPNFPTNSPPSNINRPLVPFHQTDVWAQGLLLGVEWTF